MLAVDPNQLDVAGALRELAENGYARVGVALSAEGLARLGETLEQVMSGRLKYEGLFFQRDADSGRYEDLSFGLGWQGPSQQYRKVEKLERDPTFRAWIENPLFERIARGHIAGEVALYRAVLFTKSAAGGTALPWHQDGGDFWGIDRPASLQIWTALDDVPVGSGCVEVVPGSHLRGLATPQGGVIPDAFVEPDVRAGRVVQLPAVAGEVLLIHNWLWHRSGVNTTGRRRAALSVCCMSAETRCLRKRGKPREFVRLFEGQSRPKSGCSDQS